jgi:hypothetical protein
MIAAKWTLNIGEHQEDLLDAGEHQDLPPSCCKIFNEKGAFAGVGWMEMLSVLALSLTCIFIAGS